VFPPLAKYIFNADIIRKRFFPLISQIGISYRDNSLSEHRDDRAFDIKAGDRFPYLLIDGESLYDRLQAPKFHLVVFSDGQGDLNKIEETATREFGDVLDVHVVPIFPAVTEAFGQHSSFAVLVRPDNYVGVISADIGLDTIRSYFADVIGYMPRREYVAV
jgi:hypothetical protein